MSNFFANEGMFAIYGVIVGVCLTWIGEAIKQRNSIARRANYAAIRAVIALDAYVGHCAYALNWEDPEPPVDRDPDEFYKMPDKFQMPDDVDWTSVPPELAQRVLEIPHRDSEARQSITFYARDLGERSFARDERDKEFLEIAHDAIEIATELRRRYSVAETTRRWNANQILDDLRKEREKRLAAQAGWQEDLFE
jgi:hypothetical protein